MGRDDKRTRRRRRREEDAAEARPRFELTDARRERVERYARESVDTHGVYLWDIEVSARGRWMIALSIDHPEATGEPGQGVIVEQCVRVSRSIEALIDEDEDLPEDYTLEVSSPGIERLLKRPEHYRRMAGQPVHLVTREPIDGKNTFDGTLVGCDDEDVVTLTLGSGEDAAEARIPLAVVKKARLTFDFDANQERNP